MDTSKQNTASKILDALTSDIIQGVFPPGEKLQIKTLKDRYKVGTSPIREALSQLIAKDLVVSENQKGFYVSNISIDDLTDIYQARSKIEGLCLDMAIKKGGDFWESKIIAASHLLAKYSKSENIDMGEWQNRHFSFHEALVAGCNSPRLFQIRQSLYEKSTRYRNLWLQENVTNYETLQANQNEHVALMVLVLERDSMPAQKLIEAHIMTPVEIIKKNLP